MAATTKAPAFKHAINEARGEVRLVIDDVELVIAATIGGLSAVSSRLQCKSLDDLIQRLSGAEVSATEAAIALLTVKGDVVGALEKLNLRHFRACAAAFTAALSHHIGGDEGNEPAAQAA